MKSKLAFRRLPAFATTIFLMLASQHSHANTWDGGAATSDSWNNTSNWNPNSLPNFANPIIFTGSVRLANINGIVTADLSVGGINFTNTATHAFNIRGNRITLNGDITTTAATSGTLTDNWGIPMILNADRTITTNTGHNLTIATVSGSVGIISQTSGSPKGLTKAGAATLTLGAANTYSGPTIVSEGTLVLTNNLSIQNSALDTSGAGVVTLGASATTPTFGGLIGATNLATVITTGYSGATNLTLNPGTGVKHTYSGAIADGAPAMTVTKTGAGTQILAGANTYTGATAVNVGTLLFSTAGTSASNVTVASGAKGGAFVAAPGGQHISSGNFSLSNGSTLAFDYDVNSPSTSTAPLSVNTFTLGTNISLEFLASVIDGETYPLVTWTTGPANTAAVTASMNPPVVAGLVGLYSVSGNTLRVTFTSSTPISWNAGDGVWDTTTSNWLNDVTPTTYNNPVNSVTFGDGLGVSGDPVVTLNSTFSPAGVTLNSTSRSYTISGSGTIAGASGLTLASGHIGRLTLVTENTYTGPTAVEGGTLRLGDGGTVGSLAPSSPISLSASGALFEVNQSDTVTQGTHFGAISGSGGFAQIGSGTTVLTLTNTFSGPTSITAGSLQFGTGGRLGVGGDYSGDVSIATGSVFQYGGSAPQRLQGILSGGGSLIQAGSGGLTLSGANTFTGPTLINQGVLSLESATALGAVDGIPGLEATSSITIGGALPATLTSNATGTIINAPITTANTGVNSTIAFGRNFAGGGVMTLNGVISGNGNVVFSVIQGGSVGNLQTLNLGATGTWAGNTTITTANSSVTSRVANASGAANVLPITTVLTMAGGEGSGSGRTVTFDLNGQNQELAGLANGGVVPMDRDQVVTSTSAATLTINNSANFIFGGATKDTATSGTGFGTTTTARITGAISLVKNGSGTFTLGGTLTNSPDGSKQNSYTGTTTVNAGTLRINNSISASSAVTVNGGDLGGTGTIGGNVTVAAAGSLAPGVTAGTLNITGDLDISAMASGAGTLKFDLDTLAGTNDRIAVGGALTLGTLALDDLAVTNLGGLEVGTYTLISGSSVPVGTVSGSTSLIATGFNGKLQITGNNLELVVTVAASSAYATWSATNAPTGNPNDDFDGDGVPNAVEFVLGGLASTNDLNKLPVLATSGGNATFTFRRAQSSIDPKTSTVIEVGTNLQTWNTAPSPYTVPDGAVVSNPGVTVVKDSPSVGTDTITLTVPQAPDARKFARLRVAITP